VRPLRPSDQPFPQRCEPRQTGVSGFRPTCLFPIPDGDDSPTQSGTFPRGLFPPRRFEEVKGLFRRGWDRAHFLDPPSNPIFPRRPNFSDCLQKKRLAVPRFQDPGHLPSLASLGTPGSYFRPVSRRFEPDRLTCQHPFLRRFCPSLRCLSHSITAFC